MTRRGGGRLDVWTNGQLVGAWTVRDGAHQFAYETGWIASPFGRPLSLSMPFTPDNVSHRGKVVDNFFDNLLPDNDAIRRRLRERFRTGSAEAFELLGAIGRDCVGAVQLLPPGVPPEDHDRVAAQPLDEAAVERALLDATGAAHLLGKDMAAHFRISIAGAQEKTALLWHDNRWCLPLDSTPTTHIFKLPLGLIGNIRADMHDSVENEWLCMQLLGLYGMRVAHVQMARFGNTRALVVERFDRARQTTPRGEPWIARLPQEDFCQALGVSGQQRYEADGGPGMRDVLRQLETSRSPDEDRLAFVKAQFLFWLLAATDGHAKNFSIHLQRGGFRMTPLYDVLSIWPILGDGPNQINPRDARLAMAVRGKNVHYKLREIQPRHWEQLARETGITGAFDELISLALQTPSVLDDMASRLPSGFPPRLFARVSAGTREHARRFLDALP